MSDRSPFPGKPRRPEPHPSLSYRPPFYLTFLRLLTISTVIGTAAVVVYSLFWFLAATQLESQVTAWAEDRRDDGMSVEFAEYKIEGYPLTLRLVLSQPALADPGAARPWAWRAERVVASLRPWWWTPIKFTAPGQHWATVTLDGRAQSFAGTVQRLDGEIALSGGRLTRVTVDLAGLDLRDSKSGEALAIGQARVTLEDLRRGAPQYSAPAASLRLIASGVRLPPSLHQPYRLPLGEHIAKLEVDGVIMGEIPVDPWPGALASWRDKGGTVEIKKFDVSYGPLNLFSNGTVSLDGALQPIAAFTARVQGFIETVDALRRQGIIRGRDAIAAKLILGALAKKDKADGTLTVSLPLTLQERIVSAGPVRLGRVPEVRWAQ